MSAIAAFVAVPVLALAATGCSSDSKESSGLALGSTVFSREGVQKVLVTNWLTNACLLDSGTLATTLKDKTFATKGGPQAIVPLREGDVKQSCLYNNGDFIIDTYTETPGSGVLYSAVLQAYGGDASKHAIVDHGDMAHPYQGYWLTVHGQTVGVVFHDKVTGVTVYMHAASAYKLDRKAYGHLFVEALGHLPADVRNAS